VKDALHVDASEFSVAIGPSASAAYSTLSGSSASTPNMTADGFSSWFGTGYGVTIALAALNPWFWG
jgi:hypothetical protein